MMFEYFPDNYPWSMATIMAVNAGGILSEIDREIHHLKTVAGKNDDQANESWHKAWSSLGTRNFTLAENDARLGKYFSAGSKFFRAATYFMTAERMCSSKFTERLETYKKMLISFELGQKYLKTPLQKVDVPFSNNNLPALFYPAEGSSSEKPAPCIIHFDGLDVMKEFLFLIQLPQEYAKRGISTLLLDHPGVGEALRINNLKLTPETEIPAGAALDYLERRVEVINKKIGIAGISLGGYYAPRAAGFEPRLKCVIAWGAINDYGLITKGRLDGTGTNLSVSHWEEHMHWVLGTSKKEELLEVTSKMTLDKALPNIRCPILVLHGENDRQIPAALAKKTISEAVNSPKADLKIFTSREGGVEHCQVDNPKIAIEYMTDWAAEVFSINN
ncbi:MAG: dienelactone hydrolase family protein [Pseudomonadota bacterium]|nr:dienelactone hydrolase family protein [Pseudomonadota bacterium]